MRILTLLLALALPCLCLNAQAANSNLTPDEQKFLAAEKALRNHDQTTYQSLAAQLRNYPLYPYLKFEELTSRLNKASPQEVGLFTQAYAHTPLALRLTTDWLNLQGQQKNWPQVAKFYTPAVSDTKLQCYYLQSLIATGQSVAAFKQVPALWLSGYTQPKTCDPVFKAWRAAGGLTPELLKARFRLALKKHQPALAKDLLPYFTPEQRETAQLWLAVYKNPDLVTQEAFLNKHAAFHKPLLAYGVARLAQRDPDIALKIWPNLVRQYHLNPDLQQQVIRSFGTTLALKGNPDALTWLNQITPEYSNATTRVWKIRTALNQENWLAVSEAIQQLLPAEQQEAVWRYWQARADQSLGHKQAAQTIYESLAPLQSYYGFLGSYQLKKPHVIRATQVDKNNQALQQLEKLPGIQRAHELLKLQRYPQARREWKMAIAQFTPAQLTQAAVLAASWQWYDRSSQTVQQAGLVEDLGLNFPLAYKRYVLQAAKAREMDPAWVFAIIRQESAFMTDIASYVGAQGLMQLMPGTAAEISRALNQPYNGSFALINADLNIHLGSYYLKKMYTRLDNHPALATAAYNAGPGAVTRWLPQDKIAEPADIWIETIPFNETRDYVKKVMAFTLIYQKQLGEKPNITPWMQPVQPKE